MFEFIKNYLNWLQKDTPTGDVERYPEIDRFGESSVKGIYVAGDLTGIPLLKLAGESGAGLMEKLNGDFKFQELRKTRLKDMLDLVIIGAGPAGISAGLAAEKAGYEFIIMEAVRPFNTIHDFPRGKPIYVEPVERKQLSDLRIEEGTKESLLEDLEKQIQNQNLPIKNQVNILDIAKYSNYFEVITRDGNYKALRVILATGKSGNPRQLKVPGEDLAKVYTRLIDPLDARDEDVLVVGGGDTALETAIAVAEYSRSVTISYRKGAFSRPKEGNLRRVEALAAQGKIKILFKSQVKEIAGDKVILHHEWEGDVSLDNTMVFIMIGKQLPDDFFKKIRVKIEASLSQVEKLMFAALLLFSGFLYFGKSGFKAVIASGDQAATIGDVFSGLFSLDFWLDFMVYPLSAGFWKQADPWGWPYAINGALGYLCFIGFVVIGIYLLGHFFRNLARFTTDSWHSFRNAYFIVLALFFAFVYFSSSYFGVEFLGKSQGFWYTFFYTLTILIFGLRRIHVHPTKYIKFQTWTLILVQAIPLFLLPEVILPVLNRANFLGGQSGFFLTQVFPGGDFGYAYRFILTWPLNIYGLFADTITPFWLVYTILFTFGFIPFIIYRWGKGAFCGWICSCGALAETLGDEYRSLAPHGPKAKKLEHAGQWILLIITVMTVLKLAAVLGGVQIPIIHTPRPFLLDWARMIYSIVVDVIFAGVLGVGVYFFLSGRVWCRFLCPLAALMHIFTRFSLFRIFADKKKCISCNICTKVCHMGIDVMNYANKGVPMNDVQCVRCSACVVHCPMDVLYFGALGKSDLDNKFYRDRPLPPFDKSDWRQGLL